MALYLLFSSVDSFFTVSATFNIDIFLHVLDVSCLKDRYADDFANFYPYIQFNINF